MNDLQNIDFMRTPFQVVAIALASLVFQPAIAATGHNVILFVPDGLRAGMVDSTNAPAMAALREAGVNFSNSHSLFPTFTMPNASAFATGHQLGDTGVFSNTIYSGIPIISAGTTVTPFLENDAVLGELDEKFAGSFLSEETLAERARDKGLGTALIGKVGPTLLGDHTDRRGEPTIVIDDATGSVTGIPLSPEISAALRSAGMPLATPGRGANGVAGDATTPGTLTTNQVQQDYFLRAATQVVLPVLKARNKPFFMVFWSRDPDGTQHNQGDSLNKTAPGINGPSSLAAIKNADDDLKGLRESLTALGLADTTDIIVAADHGFSTISKESKTSPSAQDHFADVPSGFLPPGFVAIDLADRLGLELHDPNAGNALMVAHMHPKGGNGVLGSDPTHPQIVVAANGGSDLVYLPTGDRNLASRVIAELVSQDYVSGLFVDPELGQFAGTLPLGAINLVGSARTLRPSIVVNFRSFASGCAIMTNCTVSVADTTLQQGQGMHGNFNRGDTFNFMAAIGPDFKTRFTDVAPVSNADVGQTIAHLLDLDPRTEGQMVGRVMSEALPGGKLPSIGRALVSSRPGLHGVRTVLKTQTVNGVRYIDAGGQQGRTAGLENQTR